MRRHFTWTREDLDKFISMIGGEQRAIPKGLWYEEVEVGPLYFQTESNVPQDTIAVEVKRYRSVVVSERSLDGKPSRSQSEAIERFIRNLLILNPGSDFKWRTMPEIDHRMEFDTAEMVWTCRAWLMLLEEHPAFGSSQNASS